MIPFDFNSALLGKGGFPEVFPSLGYIGVTAGGTVIHDHIHTYIHYYIITLNSNASISRYPRVLLFGCVVGLIFSWFCLEGALGIGLTPVGMDLFWRRKTVAHIIHSQQELTASDSYCLTIWRKTSVWLNDNVIVRSTGSIIGSGNHAPFGHHTGAFFSPLFRWSHPIHGLLIQSVKQASCDVQYIFIV